MKKITDIYKSLNEEKTQKFDININDLIKDEDKSDASKKGILQKKWATTSSDIEEVIEFKKKKLEAELAKLEEVDQSKIDEAVRPVYKEVLKKAKQEQISTTSELDDIISDLDKDDDNGITGGEYEILKKTLKLTESSTNEGEQNEYERFFNAKLKKWAVNSPNELSDEDKKKFFAEIEKEWDKEEESLRKLDSKKVNEEEAEAKKKEELEEKKKCKSKKVNESDEVIDTYTSKYFHFYESMFAKVDTKEKIDEIYAEVLPKLSTEKDLNEARAALEFFKKYRMAELGIE